MLLETGSSSLLPGRRFSPGINYLNLLGLPL